MKRTQTKRLIEAALMVSLATVLSIFKIVEMPYGGSVTLASMLPIVVLSYRCGIGWGVGSAACYAVIQQLLGLKNLSYFTTWQSVIAVIALDYLLPFVIIGVAGIFRPIIKRQASAIAVGSFAACLIRYISHVIGGATVWAGLSIPDAAAFWYSVGYNATYMLPETVILVSVGYYLCSVIDFTREVPARMIRRSNERSGGALYALSGLSLLAGVVIDVVLVAPKLQDSENGMFIFSGFSDVNWVAVGVVSAICIALCLVCFFLALKREKDN